MIQPGIGDPCKMMRFRHFLAYVAVGMACGIIAMPADAAIETFTANYGTSSSPLPLDTTQSLSLNTFNPALGTLTGITINLYSEDTLQTEIVNMTSGALPYSMAGTTVPITVTALNGLTTSASASDGPFQGTAAGMATTLDGGPPPIAANNSATVPSSDFSLYEGSGPQTFNVSVLVGEPFVEGSGASLLFGGLGNSYGSVEVVYDYSPVPEPATGWAGLAAVISCCGFGAAKRLRRLGMARVAFPC
jgi:hypothetical protein